jgi:hypothetical protein
LFTLPIIVDNPMSWNASELGDPTLCLLLFSELNEEDPRFSFIYTIFCNVVPSEY